MYQILPFLKQTISGQKERAGLEVEGDISLFSIEFSWCSRKFPLQHSVISSVQLVESQRLGQPQGSRSISESYGMEFSQSILGETAVKGTEAMAWT